MSPLKKALLVWCLTMGLFLGLVIYVARFGHEALRKIDSHARLTRGTELLAANMLDEAALEFESVVDLDNRDLRPRALLVQTLLDLGRFDEAVARAEEGVQTAPKDLQAAALLLLGKACRGAGRWESARDAFVKAVQAAPNSAEAQSGLASATEALHDYPAMAETLAKLAELGAQDASPEYAAERAGHEQAIARLKGETRDGNAASAHYRLGMAYKALGRWKEAVEAFSAAAQSPNATADASFWAGVDAELGGDLAGGVQQYQRALERCPNHANALVALARCLKRMDAAG